MTPTPEQTARIVEGRQAFHQGKTVASLRIDPPVGTAEAATNMDRIAGYIEALAAMTRTALGAG
jgi:hypothetical protein